MEGEWENKEGIIRPPDYIYYVRDSTGYIYGINAAPRPWKINGRRTDVERLPSIGENEFRWLMQAYRDNYGCKIDYVVFINYGAWYPAWDMWNDGIWKARALSFAKDADQNLIFEFENHENVMLNYHGNVSLQADQRSLAGYTVVYVNKDLRVVGVDARYPLPAPDIPETLLLFLYAENGDVLTLPNGVYAYLLDLPVPMLVNVFSPVLYGTDYLEGINYPVQVVYTSSNSQVKVCKVNYVPQPISVNDIKSDNARINDNTPTFRWSSAIGAAKYELWVDDDSAFTSPEIVENTSEVTYTSTVTLIGENYYWKVRAYGADDNATDWSPVWAFTIDTVSPSPPSLTSPENGAVENNLTQIFTWTQPEPDATYRIQIDDEASFTSPYVREDNAVPDNSYTYTFPRNGTYYWRVCARDTAHNWSSWSENYQLTVLVPPGQPRLSSPANLINDNTPTFEWTIGFNADNHRLLVDNDNDFSSPIENRLFGATDSTYVPADENSLPDGSYSWKVIAINEVGENESAVWMFTIDTVPPAAPELFAPDNGATVREVTPIFDWGNVSDPSGVTYTLEVASDNEFTSPVLTKTGLTASSYNSTTADALINGTYYWRVRAIDGANNVGDPSPVRWFVINTQA
jgi:hypothetical protein